MAAYEFLPLTAEHLPLLRGWLVKPHVAEWWGDPREQFALVSEDLDDPHMEQFIVATAGRPFGYLQCYDPTVWPEGALGPQPEGTRGIDQFIGEPDMLNCGHGSAFIRAHVDNLFARGAPVVGTDPDPDNPRAIRAYEKAGFVASGEVLDWEGRPVLLMLRHAPQNPRRLETAQESA
jgi:aminoglycoside 6'-N-acetyltransferase